MNRGLVIAAALFGISLTAGVQAGDWTAAEGQWYLSPLAGMTFEDTARQADNGLALSLGLGKQLSDDWGLEFSLIGSKHNGFNKLAQYGLGVDLLRHFDSAGVISPYLLIGTGWLRTDIVEAQVRLPEQDYDNLIGSLGLGFIAPLGNSAMRLRGELRYRADFHSPTFDDLQVLIGFYRPLGAKTARQLEALPDSDGDGVPDDVDLCPATPREISVDRYGCETDRDGDGVSNGNDRCPNTPRGTKVDSYGCVLAADTDRDGVADHKDRCPGTPRSAVVGEDGCELDGDGDGIVNSLDSCPDSAKGARVDVRGCEITDKIELPGVHFELSSARLLAQSFSILDQAVETLKKHPDIKVEAAGYTDSTGTDNFNIALSAKRAGAVRQYLIDKGITAGRVTAKGYGEANPVADNSTLEGRKRNRRVDLRIVR